MGSTASYLEIINHTNQAMTITIQDIVKGDWDGDSRPDNNFHNVRVPAQSSLKKREELKNGRDSAWFNMHIRFANGHEIAFRADQWTAWDANPKGLNGLSGTHQNDYFSFQINWNGVNQFHFISKYWQADLADTINLTELTLPGTHESCAIHAYAFAQCQTLTLLEQLELGIRFFDIRCRHIDDKFTIHHGIYYEHLGFGHDVVTVLLDFLRIHPTEFVIMSVDEESKSQNVTRSFEQTLINQYISGKEDKFWLGRDFPTVESIRGKIILFSRYQNSSIGLNARPWKDSATFSIEERMRVQDVYQMDHKDPITGKPTLLLTDIGKKWAAIKTLLDEAESTNTDRLYVNFISCYSSLYNQHHLGNQYNGYLFAEIKLNKNKRYGCVLMDFPTAVRPEIVPLLISQNFHY